MLFTPLNLTQIVPDFYQLYYMYNMTFELNRSSINHQFTNSAISNYFMEIW